MDTFASDCCIITSYLQTPKEEEGKLDATLHCGNTSPGSALERGVVLGGRPIAVNYSFFLCKRAHLAKPVCPHLRDPAFPASEPLFLLPGSELSRVETLPPSRLLEPQGLAEGLA